jgi:hypothetical protein
MNTHLPRPIARTATALPFERSGAPRTRWTPSPARPLPPQPYPPQPTEALAQAYETRGGLLAADLLSGLMRGGTAQPISQLARWIVGRHIVTLPTRDETLVPLFQFQPGFASLQPGLAPVLAELAEVFDDFELATWFATPNSSLGGAAPADVLARDPRAVHEAARIDRFVATGG